MSELFFIMATAMVASALFVYGVHMYINRSRSYEVEFVDFVRDYTGEEYALFVDCENPDATIAIPMESIDKIVKARKKRSEA